VVVLVLAVMVYQVLLEMVLLLSFMQEVVEVAVVM
jgi:hypothetical protein